MHNIQKLSESIVAAGEMGVVHAKKAWNASLLFCMLALAASLCACASGASSISQSAADASSPTAEAIYLQGTSFAPETEKAINDFIASYGKDSPAYDGRAYVVSDFDNTTSIFDITYQCSVYQLQSMSFSLNPEDLKAALSTGIDAEKNAPWLDDIDAAYSYLWENYGPFTAAGLDEQAQARIQADPQWTEFATKMKAFYLHEEKELDDAAACEWIMWWYAGMTEEEVYDLFKRACEAYKDADTEHVTWTSPEGIPSKLGVVSCDFELGVSVTPDVKAMLEAYRANGIDVWICSASHADGVRAAVDAFGLSDYVTGVIGMTQQRQAQRYVAAYDYETGFAWRNLGGGSWKKTSYATHALPSREGKVAAIENALIPQYGTGPLAGFMDASGDFNFCTELDSLKMVICYNRANRSIREGAGLVAIAAVRQQEDLGYDLTSANAAGDTYYLLQGRDENGMRSLRPSNRTIRFGESEERLFAGEENDALLAYAREKGLSTKEIFDTFAPHKDAQDPANALGVEYGYLNDYDGYHSHSVSDGTASLQQAA